MEGGDCLNETSERMRLASAVGQWLPVLLSVGVGAYQTLQALRASVPNSEHSGPNTVEEDGFLSHLQEVGMLSSVLSQADASLKLVARMQVLTMLMLTVTMTITLITR